jgi:hypothetical protein
MAKVKWNEKIAQENFKIYTDYKSCRSTWILDAIKYNNFRHGYHFSDAETAAILKQRQAPIPVNITTAICETAEALLTASDPIITVVPARVVDEKERQIAMMVAQKYEAAVKCTWYNSLGSLQYDRIVRDYNNVGRGLSYIFPSSTYGEFGVSMKYLSFLDFFPDPNSRDPHYTDSDNMIVSYVLSKKAAYKMSKYFDIDLTWEQFQKDFIKGNFIDDPTNGLGDKYISRSYKRDEVVRFIQRLSLEEETMYYVVPTQSATPEMMAMSLAIHEQLQYKSYLDIPEDVKQFIEDGLLEKKSVTNFFLAEYTSFGGLGMKRVYPIDQYNIVPFVYDHSNHPYPLGRVHYIYPIQRALNKCLMISILNASLSNNIKWLYEEKSITDTDAWDNMQSIPGVRLPYRKLSPESLPPTPVGPVPLSEVFLQFPRYLQSIMEYVAGISSVLMGQADQSTPDVGRVVASMQTAGGERVKRRLRNIDASLTQVGRVICKFYKEYAPTDGSLAWVESFNKIKNEEYNQIQPDPNDKTKLIYKPGTDLGVGFRDLRFILTPNQGYENANIAQMLTLLSTQLGVPEMLPVILKKLNIPEAEEIMESIDRVKQANATIQQQQQALDQLNKVAEGQAKQVSQLSQNLTIKDFESKFVRVLEKTKNQFKMMGFDAQKTDKMLDALNPMNIFTQQQENTNGQQSDNSTGSGEQNPVSGGEAAGVFPRAGQ